MAESLWSPGEKAKAKCAVNEIQPATYVRPLRTHRGARLGIPQLATFNLQPVT
jgi:hypothetical protein